MALRHDKLMCNDNRLKRGFTPNADFPLCTGILETGEHVIRECKMAEVIWKKFLSWDTMQRMTNLDFEEWLRGNLLTSVAKI